MNMMKKITNWTFGSIFRTIGRIVAYLVIGFLITLFITKKDYVKADSYIRGYDQVWYSNEALTSQWTSGTTMQYITQLSQNHYDDNMQYFTAYMKNQYNIDDLKGGHLTIPYSLDFAVVQQNQTVLNGGHCRQWTASGSNYYCSDFVTDTGQQITAYRPYISLNVYLQYTSGYTDNCEVDYNKNYISCPIINANGLNLKSLIVAYRVYYVEGGNNYFRFGLGLKMNGWSNDAYTTQQAIENQTEQQEQQHNETINTLTNDTTYDTNETENIFSDFENMLPDEGIVTQLITLPISLYTNILNSVNGTCQAFSLGSLLGTNLTLPCINVSNYLGSQLWSVIDILMSGFFILTIVRKFIKVFENMSSMKEGDVLSD